MKNLSHTLSLWMIIFGLFISTIELTAANNSNMNMVAPTANFSATVTGICVNNIVTFTDQSTDAPTSWAWNFTPNTVSFQNGTDATSQNPQVSFNAIGQYDVSLTATNTDGSNTLTQENFITVYGQSTAPLNEGFGNAIPPTNWNIINPDSSEGWERTTTTQSDGTTGNVIRMDNYQYDATGQLDYLILPKVDISRVTNPLLTFDVAYAAFGPNNFETLHIEYSTNCGENFAATTYSKQDLDLATVPYQGSGWGPQIADNWRADTLVLTPYKSEETVLQFIQTAGYGNGLFLDNIRVFTNDAPIANFATSQLTSCPSDIITLNDESMELPTTWAWSFSPNTVTFQNGTDANSASPEVSFDQLGIYTITLDVTSANGASQYSTTYYTVDTGAAPLSEDFSSNLPSDWDVINPDNLEGWEFTTTTQSDGNTGRMIRMDNYQYNAPGQLDYFILPALDLSNVTTPTLCFDVAYAAFGPNNFETLHIEYSTDCGANFAATTYSKQDLDLATVDYQGNGWGPSDAAHWRSETVDLTPYKSAGTIFSFIQTAGYGNGLFIDNIRIKASDIPVADFSINATTACANEVLSLTDLSSELPSSWTWSFSPNTVTFQNGTSANSQHPQVSFDTYGTYNITLNATNDIGSNILSKQALVQVIGESNAPLTEDFEIAVPPADWGIANTDGQMTWDATTVTGSDGNASQVVWVDNYQYNAADEEDYLVLPSVDLTGFAAPTLYFDVAYAPQNAANFERLRIDYTTDCGANFTPTTYDKSGTDLATVSEDPNSWQPTDASHWRTESLSLVPYVSMQTALRFIQTNGNGNGLFLDNFRIIEEIILPVELLSFKGYEKDCEVILDWISASEEQFDYYELERSQDGKNFQAIAKIESNGGVLNQSYTYTDNSRAFAPYYRLKMIDKDGTFAFSDIIRVARSCNTEEVFTIRPNIIAEQSTSIQIDFSSPLSQEQITIANLYGQTIKSIDVPVSTGLNTIRVDVNDLAAGTYIIYLSDGKRGQKLLIF